MPPPPLPSGHTPGHVRCPICEADRLETIQPAEFGALRFLDAAPIWLREHQMEIAAKTQFDYKYYLRALTQFFGDLPLREIHIGHVRQYQDWRQLPYVDSTGRTRSAGPSAINHELNTLAQILNRAGLWTEIKRWYKPLRIPKSRVGKALAEEDVQRLFYVASLSGRWEVAFLAELLSANTAAGPGEIKHLRIRDIDLLRKSADGVVRPCMHVFEAVKNEYRERTISLNPTAVEVVKRLLKRYGRLLKQQKVEPESDHYLLPGRARRGRNQVDFFKPQLDWHHAWDSIRKRAGLPEVRPYDLRHHCITMMLENPDVAQQTVQEIAGHVSKRMTDHYSHIRDTPKRAALTAVEIQAPPSELQMMLNFDAPPKPPSRVIEIGTPVMKKDRK